MSIKVSDLIKAKEDAASVAYQRFALLANSKPESLFCFFENKDAPYYHPRIKQYCKREYEYISCGNKAMVLKTWKLIKHTKQYSRFNLAFFIDRDFDDSIGNTLANVYETPCYSIENLYCSPDSFKELLKTNFQIGEDEQLHEKIMSCYSKLFNDFLNASLTFNAWYKLQKSTLKKNKNNLNGVSLSDSLIPNYIVFNFDKVVKNYDLTKIREKFPDAFDIQDKEIARTENILKKGDLAKTLRGKYIFTFYTTFIRMLIDDGASKSKRNLLSRKVKYHLDQSMALTILTIFAETPECLIEFLEQYN